MNDGGLLRDYVETQSEAAFARLAERHLNLVYATALRQTDGNVENAKDVTQKVFIRLARKAGSLLGHPVLAGWLYRATCLEAAAWQRAERRRVHREHEASRQSDGLAENAMAVDWGRLKPVIDEALLELNERDRVAILLRFFDGQRLAEIGQALGLGENAARMRVDRALEKLRALLARRGIASSSGALAVALAANPAQAAPAGFAASVAGAALGAGSAPGIVSLGINLFLMTKFQLAIVTGALVLLTGGVVGELRQTASLRSRLTGEQRRGIELARQAEPSVENGPVRPISLPGASLPGTSNRASIQTVKVISDRGNAALYRRLALPAAELEQLKELLAERELRASEAMRIARGTGLTDLTLAEQRQVRTLAEREMNERIRALLSEAGFRYFESYDRTKRVRSLFSPYTDEMQALGDPLTDLQADRLVEVLHAALEPGLDSLRDEGGFELPASALTTASGFLSLRQLQQLKEASEQWSARRRITALNRIAAQQGKLELNEQSARDYPGSPVAKD